MNLSEHFTLEELLNSPTAVKNNITEQFSPSTEIIESLKSLCVNVLEPLRNLIGKPLGITSGYRCAALNKAVGGVDTGTNVSQHVKGQAADTHVDGMTVEGWYQFVKKANIPFDQLIQEYDSWGHISFNTTPGAVQRGECLRIREGTGYISDGFGTFKKNA